MSGAVMPIVRVAILADSRLTEMALPAELPLREILPAVQAFGGSRGRKTVTPVPADAGAASHLSLAPIGGAPFSLDASLDTVGVVDGDLLALQPVPAGPAAPGIVEDIADAAMIFSTSRLKPWGTAHIQRGALAAAIGVALAGNRPGGHLPGGHRCAGRTAGGQRDRGGHRVGRLAGQARSARTGMALSIAALVPIGAALALAVPGRFGPAQLMLAAAGVTAWSLIALLVPGPERERVVAFLHRGGGGRSRCAAGGRCRIALAATDTGHRLRADRGGAAGHHPGGSAFGAVGALPAAGHPGTGRPHPVGAVVTGARGLAAASARQRRPSERFHRRRGAAQRPGIGGDRVAPRGVEWLGLVRGGGNRGHGHAARPGVGFGRVQVVAARSALSGGRRPVGVLHRDGTLRRRLRRGAGARRARARCGWSSR